MQISTIKNPNFEKPFRNPSNRTQVNNLKKKNWGYLSAFRVCLVTAKMFNFEILAKIEGKEANFFSSKY
jgi:hypothetical protein